MPLFGVLYARPRLVRWHVRKGPSSNFNEVITVLLSPGPFVDFRCNLAEGARDVPGSRFSGGVVQLAAVARVVRYFCWVGDEVSVVLVLFYGVVASLTIACWPGAFFA